MNNKKFNKSSNIIDNKMLDLYEFLNRKEFLGLAKKMNIDDSKIQKEGDLLKFRAWESNFKLPNEIIVKTEVIKYGASRKEQNIIKRVLYAKIEKFTEFKNRWNNKNKPPRFWGNAHQIPYYEKNGWLWIKLHDNWFFDEIIPKSEDFIYRDKWLYYRIPKNYIGISYVSGDYHAHFILVPSSIRADNFFFEGLGLQQGDGTQSLPDVHVTFTNSCEDLIHHQIEWFRRLGISNEVLRIYPEIPSFCDIEEEVSKWRNVLNLSKINEYQFRNPKINDQNLKNSLVQILFHNKLFKVLYLHLLYNLRKEVPKDRNKAINYMKGIFASEGAVKLRANKILGGIKISASVDERRSFYKECLNSVGIKTSKDDKTKGSEAVIITNFNNFKKIFELGLFELHPKKQEKFINALMRYQNKKEELLKFGDVQDG